MFPLSLKGLCIISRPQCRVKKALCKSAARRQAAPLCGCCRGLLGAWNRIVSRERSRGWALQCTAVLVALLCTPTLFLSRSASDNRSISCSLFQPLSPMLLSFLLPSSLYCILRTFDTDHFPPHSFLYSCLLYFLYTLNQFPSTLTSTLFFYTNTSFLWRNTQTTSSPSQHGGFQIVANCILAGWQPLLHCYAAYIIISRSTLNDCVTQSGTEGVVHKRWALMESTAATILKKTTFWIHEQSSTISWKQNPANGLCGLYTMCMIQFKWWYTGHGISDNWATVQVNK